MDASVKAADYDVVVTLNWRFHARINALAESPKLTAFIRAPANSMPREYVLEFPGTAREATREKRKIHQAMLQRDAEGAEALMQQHVERSGANLIGFFRERGLLPDG